MFERFTERARKVMVLAQEEARHFRHNYVGTEHVLLGLLREGDGVGAQALTSCGVTLDWVRTKVEDFCKYGEEGSYSSQGYAPLTPRTRKCLEFALREALSLGHSYIGTEHILLGLVRERDGFASRALNEFNAPEDIIRNAVMEILNKSKRSHWSYHSKPKSEEVEWSDPEPGSIERVIEEVYTSVGQAYVDIMRKRVDENTAYLLDETIHDLVKTVEDFNERLLIFEATLRDIDGKTSVHLSQEIRTLLYSERRGK
jgi:ATP-dependent Clp protease ATP-binding subunit ClpA